MARFHAWWAAIRPTRRELISDLGRICVVLLLMGFLLWLLSPRVRDGAICASFRSQAAAQAYYRDHPDATRLDTDRDGLACEKNRLPRDLMPVVRR